MPEVRGGVPLTQGSSSLLLHPTQHSAPELLSPSAGVGLGLPRQTSGPLVSKQASHRLEYPSVLLQPAFHQKGTLGFWKNHRLSPKCGARNGSQENQHCHQLQIQLAGPTGLKTLERSTERGAQDVSATLEALLASWVFGDSIGGTGGRGVGGSRFRLPAEEMHNFGIPQRKMTGKARTD